MISSRSKPYSFVFYLERNTRMAAAPVLWPFLSKSELQKGNIRNSNETQLPVIPGKTVGSHTEIKEIQG